MAMPRVWGRNRFRGSISPPLHKYGPIRHGQKKVHYSLSLLLGVLLTIHWHAELRSNRGCVAIKLARLSQQDGQLIRHQRIEGQLLTGLPAQRTQSISTIP